MLNPFVGVNYRAHHVEGQIVHHDLQECAFDAEGFHASLHAFEYFVAGGAHCTETVVAVDCGLRGRDAHFEVAIIARAVQKMCFKREGGRVNKRASRPTADLSAWSASRAV